MATEYYVDPSIAAASGAGTVGDPYGDLQHALDTVTRDSTNGDRFNIKAGTDEILAAALSLATYGTPTAGASLTFQGYTSSQGDGGIGSISGNGSYTIMASTAVDYVRFFDMKLHNTGSNAVLNIDNYIYMANCEVTNSTSDGINIDDNCTVINCHVHNVGGVGIRVGLYSHVISCYIANGTNDVTDAIINSAQGSQGFNIINVDGNSDGIQIASSTTACYNNSVYSAAAGGGTGHGIRMSGVIYRNTVWNNIVEGFSTGVSIGSNTDVNLYVGNRYYNNGTDTDINAAAQVNYNSDNSTLGASPFTSPGGADFSVGAAVNGAGYPSSFNGSSTSQALETGAAQTNAAAAGGTVPPIAMAYYRRRRVT